MHDEALHYFSCSRSFRFGLACCATVLMCTVPAHLFGTHPDVAVAPFVLPVPSVCDRKCTTDVYLPLLLCLTSQCIAIINKD